MAEDQAKSSNANWFWGILAGIVLVLVGRLIFAPKSYSEKNDPQAGSISDRRNTDRAQNISDDVRPLYTRMRARYGGYVGGESNIFLKPGDPWILVVQPQGSIDYRLKQQIRQDWKREWERSRLWEPGDPEVSVDFVENYKQGRVRLSDYPEPDEERQDNFEPPSRQQSESGVRSGEDVYQQDYDKSRRQP